MDTGTSAFLQGFMKNFDKAGGTDKLSSWAGRNIADGKHYDPYEDPEFIREYQRASQIGTEQAKQNVTDEYGQYIDAEENTTPQEALWGKEQPKLWGLPQQQAREVIMKAAQEGKDVKPLTKQFNNKFDGQIGSELINTLQPQKQPKWNNMDFRQSLNWLSQQAKAGNDVTGQLQNFNQTFGTDFTPEQFSAYAPEEQKPGHFSLAKNILADQNVSEAEQQLWNKNYPNSSPQDFYNPPSKTQNTVDLTGLTGMKGLNNVPIDKVNTILSSIKSMRNFNNQGDNNEFINNFMENLNTVFVPKGEDINNYIPNNANATFTRKETDAGKFISYQTAPGNNNNDENNLFTVDNIAGTYNGQRVYGTSEGAYITKNPDGAFTFVRENQIDQRNTGGQQLQWDDTINVPSDVENVKSYIQNNTGQNVILTSPGRRKTTQDGGEIVQYNIQYGVKEDKNQDNVISENRRITTAPDGTAIYGNINDIAVTKNGEPFTGPNGNQYYVREDNFSGRKYLEPIKFNIQDAINQTNTNNPPEKTNNNPNYFQQRVNEIRHRMNTSREKGGYVSPSEAPGLISSVIDKATNIYNNFRNNQGNNTNVNDVVQQFMENNEGHSPGEIAQQLENKRMDPEWRKQYQQLEQETGVSIDEVIEKLKYYGANQ